MAAEAPANDTGLLLGINKKARQVLLDTTKGEDNYMNIYEVKEKAMAAMEDILPAPPQGTEIQEVIKLWNSSMILQFNTKEATDWLHTPEIEISFTRKFDPDTTIRDWVHPVMVPRIPLTFDPSNPTHLREVEEVNQMPPKAIKKARWIKPEYRHAPRQSCAHAIFTISSATDTNRILRDGVTDLQGPPLAQANREKIDALERRAQEIARDLRSRDDVQISYLETLEERDNDNLRLAQMLAR
jgi:hypothetical protein